MLSQSKFEEFRLSKTLTKRLTEEIGLKRPTLVQAACIRPILEGKHCIAQAPTGSGKTMAFGIPMIEKWSKDPRAHFGLVITPTRELAFQIKEQFQILGGSSLKVHVITGGEDYIQQYQLLENRVAHFIIATPGRLNDLIQSDGDGAMLRALRQLEMIVLDEADRLLQQHFEPDLSELKSIMLPSKQYLFFSATIPSMERMKVSLELLTNMKTEPFVYEYEKDAIYKDKLKDKVAEVEKVNATDPDSSEKRSMLFLQNLIQKYIPCSRDYKDGYLMELLRSIRDDNSPANVRSMIIFASTCRECEVLSTLLNSMGFSNVSLHSKLSQKDRKTALSEFKSSRASVLVATDVASRGLDIKTVDLVINYAVPMPEDYVHRVGRTGRSTQQGLAITFMVIPRDVQYVTNVENYIRDKLDEMKIDEVKVLQILTEVQSQRKLADVAVKTVNPFEERAKKKRQLEEERAKEEKRSKKRN